MTPHKKRAKARKKSVKRLKLAIRTAHEKRITDAAYLRGFIDSALLAAAGFARAAAAFAPLHPDALHRRRVERALEAGFPAVPMKRPGFAPGGLHATHAIIDEVGPEAIMRSRYSSVKDVISPRNFEREYLVSPAPAKPPVCSYCKDRGEVVDGSRLPMDWRVAVNFKPCPECVEAGRVVVVPRGSGKCGMGCGCFNQCELKNPKASTLPANARVFIRDEYR